ncbi:hypothetical protein TMatcc_008413 [Talaromyces marneffei ATCC 18224]|uniref:Uncharacterized protein n=1 Tax=Talaromyces marneffei (strain ATCC 18224 / CBS 334.59 / QM 7333) TaxID=441960 RepID=B6QM29_TALMQ|nr:conserved hypothetical protein [Talaromyces marneffei ATCC 18224]KAE8550388.1 hypothetical protein EYB25_006614 [Talaromyces marneffei]
MDIPVDFHYDEVNFYDEQESGEPPAPLGALAYLKGSFDGTGLNTIFRPNCGPPPLGTKFHRPVSPVPPTFPSDNVLELNLTADHITFSSRSLGRVPNRGFGSQNDITLNGVSYVQHVNDMTNVKTGLGNKPKPTGIHFETGLWMNIPATNVNPVLNESLTRMGSIPHGTTINAQCLFPTSTQDGPPNILPVSIKPFAEGNIHEKVHGIHSLHVDKKNTPRLPQDLTKFIATGTINQAILDDPNTVLRTAIEGLNITETITFAVSTEPPAPEFGGGTANIAFLNGTPGATNPNAHINKMKAQFWIEKVQWPLEIPVYKPGQAPLQFSPKNARSGLPTPVFQVSPPYEITKPRTITAPAILIQYSQVVFMTFDQITWPHISVSTLAPSDPIPVPDSVWS